MLIDFNEKEHCYTYNGKTLHGVTKAISALLGKNFPVIQKDTVNNFTVSTAYGSAVHKEVELYFKAKVETTLQASKWVVSTLKEFCIKKNIMQNIQSEVIVSDLVSTASKVDVVIMSDSGAYLFDIKTTSVFDRTYCSLQLSLYKYLYEKNYGCKVLGLYVLSTKKQRLFKIKETSPLKVQAVLEYNKMLYL